jgi:hypothetical protein
MLNDNLDKYIKDNLENARVDWDKNSMWDDIESQLPTKKKDRKGFFFLLGLLLLLVSVGGGYLLLDNGYLNSDLNVGDPIVEPLISSPRKIVNAENQISALNNIKQEKDEKIETKIINEKDIVSIDSNLQLNNGEDQIIRSANRETSVIDKEGARLSSSRVITEKKSKDNSDVMLNRVESIVQSDDASQKHGILKQLVSVELVSNIDFNKSLFFQREIPNLYNAAPDVIELHFNYGTGLQLGFYSGIGTVHRSLETQSNESLLNLREQFESTLEMLHSSLKLRKRISDLIFVAAGIEYQRINEKLDYTESELLSTSIRTDSAYVATTSTGSLQYFSGDVEATFTRSRRSIRYNAHHSINMPIHIGFSNLITPKASISAYMGPVINLHQNYTGYNISPDGIIVQSDAIERGSLLHALDIGTAVDYRIGRRIDFSLGAFYRKALTTFSIDSNVFQSYDNLNLQVGILYNFF